MPLLNRLAEFFGAKPAADVNALSIAKASPYISKPTVTPEDYGFGGADFSYGTTMLPYNTPVNIKGYRYDKRTGKLETLPKKFNMETVRLFSEAAGDAARRGVPGIAENISPEVIAAMLLKEGREDLGANQYNHNDPESRAIYDEYKVKYGPYAATAVAAMYDKAKVAKRLGIPFANAWIGTGTSMYGETGKAYAADTENFKRIVAHPKNQSLLRFIRGSMSGPAKR